MGGGGSCTIVHDVALFTRGGGVYTNCIKQSVERFWLQGVCMCVCVWGGGGVTNQQAAAI